MVAPGWRGRVQGAVVEEGEVVGVWTGLEEGGCVQEGDDGRRGCHYGFCEGLRDVCLLCLALSF